MVVTDSAPGMAGTITDIWPEAAIVADKIHVIQLLTKAIEQTRQFALGDSTFKHNQRRLLMTIPDKLEDDEHALRNNLLEVYPKLQELY